MSRFLHLPETVLQITSRLRSVQIENLDALQIMGKYDRPETIFYCDPPYVPETRQGSDIYRFEFSMEDHERFVVAALNCRGAVAISGYDHPLYERLDKSGWSRVEMTVSCRSNVTARSVAARPQRREVVWMNYEEEEQWINQS